MIKIPATDEGIPAIEEALYEGLNINVTLLFAVSAYERVMEAFVRAMERRHEEGKPLDRHSVASFFVSRVDTEVDKRLEAAGRSDLAGRAGLANARAAYRAFQQRLRGRALRRAARGRRPGPAPAVGVDRREEPAVPRDALRLRARRAGHGQHDAAADADGRPPARARSPARPPPRTRPPTSTRCARRASTSTTSPTSCCATASTRSWSRWPSCSTASSASARRSSPTARPRSRPTCRPSSSSRSPSASSARTTRTSPAASGSTTARCGRPRARPR